ncbi:ABC transporter ATP-binding protein [Natronococcus wangiae]|uniref:ABC transporter ATP-binding protein n=1 Tax=Natronococcus wangiae TaxID=3068275 RepID=UPI00273F59E3|nr:ABC transporter ATP-binding protein [Natronococcus sp. AD5]
MLEISGVTKIFGGLVAVDDVTFSLESEEIVGLIGPNGAGKTTLFNTITGVIPPDSGSVAFDGAQITGEKLSAICRRGIVRTFQIVRTFDESTVLENVQMGAIFGGSHATDAARRVAEEYISFVGLAGKEHAEASSLTMAERKHVELARGLACEPKLLMLDEIGSGLTPAEIEALTETIERIRDELGVSIFWIEHVVEAIMETTDRILVLNDGQLIAEGAPAEIRNDERVTKAYLGESG